jgi:hypothetical protein
MYTFSKTLPHDLGDVVGLLLGRSEKAQVFELRESPLE